MRLSRKFIVVFVLATLAPVCSKESGSSGSEGSSVQCFEVPLQTRSSEGETLEISEPLTPPKAMRGLDQKNFAWDKTAEVKCWCLPAHKWWSWGMWGATRVVRTRPYDPTILHVWMADSASQLESTIDGVKDNILLQLGKYLGYQSHACSPISDSAECKIRVSPFAPICIGTKGYTHKGRIRVTVQYERVIWVPILIAMAVFICAPIASQSLWAYYGTGAMLSAVLMVGIITFFMCKRILGPRQAVFMGFLSWGGVVWQGVIQDFLFHPWFMLFIISCGFSGFLIAYNNPPTYRGQVSIQLLLQFCSVVTVVLSAPNFWREGIVLCACMFVYQAAVSWHQMNRKGLSILSILTSRTDSSYDERQREEDASNGFVTPKRPTTGRQSWVGGSSTGKLSRAGSRSTGKRRLTEKHFIEQNYSGPKKASVLRSNPFHCTGAQEYMTEDQYRQQAIDYTAQQEQQLLDYMASEGIEKFSHLLTPAGRRALQERLGESEMPAGRDDDSDYSDD